MGDYKDAERRYVIEVEAVAAKLIRDGLAGPYEAITQAHEIVQARRRTQSLKKLEQGNA